VTASTGACERLSNRGAPGGPPERRARVVKGVPGSRILRAAGAMAFAVALGWLAVSAALVSRAAWVGATDLESVEALARQLPANVAYDHMLARAELASGRFQAALRRLEAALTRNPLVPALWLDFARASLALGQSGRAVAAASAARDRDSVSGAVCYDAAVVLFQAGATEEALDGLRCAAEFTPQRARDVYDLAWAVLGDGERIRRDVVPRSAAGWRGYASYARGHRREEVSPAWAEFARYRPSPSDRLDYVDFLVRSGRGAEAGEVWAEAYGNRGPNLVFNGSFETESMGRGLDWILGSCDGARTATVAGRKAPDGERVLEVTFSGSNVAYSHASQFIPVQGGRRYSLSAFVRSEGVTSLSAPRLTVRGYTGCSMGTIAGRELSGTIPWSEERLTFTTPPECSVILVQLRRESTKRFDRDISGRVLLDRVELTAADDAQT